MRSRFKSFFYKSIASGVMYTFIFVTMIPSIALWIYAYSFLADNIRIDYSQSVHQIVSGIDKNLEIYFNEIRKTTDGIFVSKEIQNLLSVIDEEQVIQDTERIQTVRAFLNDTYGGRGDIVGVSLYSMTGLVCESNMSRLKTIYPEDQDILKEIEEANSAFIVAGARYQTSSKGHRRNIITVGRMIKNLETGKGIGFLLIDIDYEMFKKMIGMSENSDLGTLLIVDEEEKVIYNSSNDRDITEEYHTTECYRENQSGRNSQSVICDSEKFTWKYYVLSDGKQILDELNEVAYHIVIVGVCSFLLFWVISVCISKSVTRPIKRLEYAMENVERNRFNEIIPAFDTYGEINRLTRRYNVMLVEIQRLLEREKELYQKQAASEYKALQMQITPHFLYNSLESINCLAQIHNEPEISEMIIGLADIFKYNVKTDFLLVTLRDEINHVKNYELVQAVRYQDSFQIFYDIKESDLEHKVTKFMLQPLVENAITHAMKSVTKGGRIVVEAETRDGYFIISVKDNGQGMDAKTEEMLRAKLNQRREEMYENQNDSHIGLLNVSLRLKLQFGEEAGISFDTEYGVGTNMYIRIPEND